MTIFKHVDFEPAGGAELPAGPVDASPTPVTPAGSAYAAAVLALGPVAYFRLNEQTGSAAADAVAGPAGAYQGGVALGQPGPIAGDPTSFAAAFDGVSGRVATGRVDTLGGAPDATVVFWLRHDGPSVDADGAVVARYVPGSNPGWLLWVDRTAFQSGRERTLSFAPDTAAAAQGRVEGPTDLVTPGAWAMFAGVLIGGSAIRLYRNAVLVAEQPAPVVASVASVPHELVLADASPSSTIRHLRGQLAEVALFDQALDPTAIASLYTLGVGA